jgi:23S rRNA (pseudouridine1915-N3)-methyltransferase
MIRILFAGKAKSDFLRAAREQYLPRLKRYRCEVIENLRPGTAREEEAFFLKHLAAGRTAVALDPLGEVLDTAGFARLLAGTDKLDLAIGGADGLPATVKAACARQVSLSALTLSHEVALVVLLEQMYRAETLAAGHPYHRA